MKYLGSCHCGAIQFEVEAPKDLQVDECNCSICSKAGFLHLDRASIQIQVTARARHPNDLSI